MTPPLSLSSLMFQASAKKPGRGHFEPIYFVDEAGRTLYITNQASQTRGRNLMRGLKAIAIPAFMISFGFLGALLGKACAGDKAIVPGALAGAAIGLAEFRRKPKGMPDSPDPVHVSADKANELILLQQPEIKDHRS